MRPTRPPAPRAPLVWALLGALWLGAVVGRARVARAPTTTGPGAAARRRRAGRPTAGWCSTRARPTLVMLAHPRCSCTRASLGRAGRADGAGAASAEGLRRVHQAGRRRGRAGWEHTDLWEPAPRIPGRHRGARRRRRARPRVFGAETSGQTFLYAHRRHAAVQRRHDRRPRPRRRQRRPRRAARAPDRQDAAGRRTTPCSAARSSRRTIAPEPRRAARLPMPRSRALTPSPLTAGSRGADARDPRGRRALSRSTSRRSTGAPIGCSPS